MNRSLVNSIYEINAYNDAHRNIKVGNLMAWIELKLSLIQRYTFQIFKLENENLAAVAYKWIFFEYNKK